MRVYNPRLPFPDLPAAQRWMGSFVTWYNGQHRHSSVRYVTPDERHDGHERQILEKRHQLYQRVRGLNPERCSGPTRNWTPVGTVVLNPRGADPTLKP